MTRIYFLIALLIADFILVVYLLTTNTTGFWMGASFAAFFGFLGKLIIAIKKRNKPV